MTINRLTLCLFFFALMIFQVSAQQVPLTHDVYDSWNFVRNSNITDDGNFVFFEIDPQDGDGELHVYNTQTQKTQIFPRGTRAVSTADSRFLVFYLVPYSDTLKALRKAKAKEEDLPRDTLVFLNLLSGEAGKIPGVKSFSIPEEGGSWLAYQMEKPLPVITDEDTTSENGENALPEETVNKGYELHLLDIEGNVKFSFPETESYQFSKTGNLLVFTSHGRDTVFLEGVYLFRTDTQKKMPLLTGEGKYQNFTFDEKGNQLAFLANQDTGEVKERAYSLYYWSTRSGNARLLADTTLSGLNEGWIISAHGDVRFSEDGKRLFFGTAPPAVPEVEDTNSDERANVDVWSWNDDFIQPHQLRQLQNERNRTYAGVIHLRNNRFVQLANENIPSITFTSDRNSDFAIGTSNLPYRRQISWEWPHLSDKYLINIQTGEITPLHEGTPGSVGISPSGRYAYWFNFDESDWYIYDIRRKRTHNLTARLPVSFVNELHDHPAQPWPYGIAGFLENDQRILIYDRFDIWSLDPAGRQPAVRITYNGRENQMRYRYVRLDNTIHHIPTSDPMLLSGFNEWDKSSGYYLLNMGRSTPPQELVHTDHSYVDLQKAKEADAFIFRRMSFTEYADLHLSNSDFSETRQISNANPHQQDYLWGSAELIRWPDFSGDTIAGILIKPQDFDPGKKYPMIVYFYEKLSDRLHQHYVPHPSRSTINQSFYASNGYVIFIPDIHYKVGYPGESAYNSVVSGTMNLLQQGFVDPRRIGLQGQSWGGYQTAYIITRTNMFAAAMAGTPVSNMTSAYGGIRWTTGLSRQFQYESSQSRLGATLWENPQLYIDNSPLFRAHLVNTPLLIMHNDKDGAVPWEQGIELFLALRRLDNPVWLLNYNNDQHNLTKRPNMIDLGIRMHQFFDHYLKDEPMPDWMKHGVPATDKNRVTGFDLLPD